MVLAGRWGCALDWWGCGFGRRWIGRICRCPRLYRCVRGFQWFLGVRDLQRACARYLCTRMDDADQRRGDYGQWDFSGGCRWGWTGRFATMPASRSLCFSRREARSLSPDLAYAGRFDAPRAHCRSGQRFSQ